MNNPFSGSPVTKEDRAEFARYDRHLEFHRNNPHVTLEEHRRKKVYALESLVAGRKAVYLDSKYWIYLREPELSPAPKTIHKIKKILRAGVTASRLICPLSFPIYMELCTQPMERRMATVSIMEELSLGVTLKAPDDVSGIEITRFFLEKSSHLKHLVHKALPVWTKIGLLFGELYPEPGHFPSTTQTTLEKFLYDSFYERSLAEMAAMKESPCELDSVANEINEERRQYPRNGQTFQQLYCNELHGLLDFNKPLIDASLKDVARLVLKPEDIPSSSFSDEIPPHVFVNLIRFATTMGRTSPGIPMQRTLAALHAAIRMDDNRPFKDNDLNDIRHTASALAYCDLFLTERSFASIANNKDVRAVAPLTCRVEWKPEDVLSALQSL
jgi:hypothetical protein